jgi:hypothetical protein
MGLYEAIKAALISFPKLLDLGKDLIARLDRLVQAAEDRRTEETRNEQRFAALETLRLQVDKDRAEMARRLSALEQRH